MQKYYRSSKEPFTFQQDVAPCHSTVATSFEGSLISACHFESFKKYDLVPFLLEKFHQCVDQKIIGKIVLLPHS